MDERFPQLPEEIYSTKLVNDIIILGTICMGLITPLLQFYLMKFYKKHGQPWNRVANNGELGGNFFSEMRVLNIYKFHH